MMTLSKQLREFGKVKANASLAKFSKFKIGGPAQFLVTVENVEKLAGLLGFVSGEGIPYFILGGGSNVLFPDDGFEGVVIKVKGEKPEVQGEVIEVSAGADLSSVVDTSVAAGLTGFEWAAGIPGSVGGAVRGNAGAHYKFAGGEMKDNVVSVTVWRSNEVLEIPNGECAFGYRDSIFKHNGDVVLSTKIKLEPGNKQESVMTTQRIIAERRGKQPDLPSAGSFFKNVMLTEWKRDVNELPPRFLEYKKIAAGWLIEQVGLKGFRVGQAGVSLTHGNFIVNYGDATQSDVLAVVEKVMGEVYTTYGINLEPEVQIVKS